MEEWTPQPQESGSLGPPRRLPPTAVGIATPPPPRRRDGGHYSRRSRLRRVARAVTGWLVTLASGVAIGSLMPAAASMTIATGLTTLLVALQMRRRRRRYVRSRQSSAAPRAA